jgi:hypothetical protein
MVEGITFKKPATRNAAENGAVCAAPRITRISRGTAPDGSIPIIVAT